MVETTVTNIVRSTVTTDDPLAALNEIVVEFLKFLANGASCLNTFFDERTELSSSCLRTFG